MQIAENAEENLPAQTAAPRFDGARITEKKSTSEMPTLALPIRVCARCGLRAAVAICSTPGCTLNGGAAYG